MAGRVWAERTGFRSAMMKPVEPRRGRRRERDRILAAARRVLPIRDGKVVSHLQDKSRGFGCPGERHIAEGGSVQKQRWRRDLLHGKSPSPKPSVQNKTVPGEPPRIRLPDGAGEGVIASAARSSSAADGEPSNLVRRGFGRKKGG